MHLCICASGLVKFDRILQHWPLWLAWWLSGSFLLYGYLWSFQKWEFQHLWNSSCCGSVCLFVCFSISACLSLSACLFVCFSVCLFVFTYMSVANDESGINLHWLFSGWKSRGWPDVCLSRTIRSLSNLNWAHDHNLFFFSISVQPGPSMVKSTLKVN